MHRSAVFDQELPEQLWIGAEDGVQLLVRDPNHGSAEQRRLATLPAGHPQGYAQCFESYVADSYAAVDAARRRWCSRPTGCRPSPTAPGRRPSATPCSVPSTRKAGSRSTSDRERRSRPWPPARPRGTAPSATCGRWRRRGWAWRNWVARPPRSPGWCAPACRFPTGSWSTRRPTAGSSPVPVSTTSSPVGCTGSPPTTRAGSPRPEPTSDAGSPIIRCRSDIATRHPGCLPGARSGAGRRPLLRHRRGPAGGLVRGPAGQLPQRRRTSMRCWTPSAACWASLWTEPGDRLPRPAASRHPRARHRRRRPAADQRRGRRGHVHRATRSPARPADRDRRRPGASARRWSAARSPRTRYRVGRRSRPAGRPGRSPTRQ